MNVNDSAQQASARGSGSVGKQIGKRLQAVGHYEPSLSLVKIPRCPACGAANPRGFEYCPACHVKAPAQTDHQDVEAAFGAGAFPTHARFLLWIGDALRRLAIWLQRS
jgi:hypothetical protein